MRPSLLGMWWRAVWRRGLILEHPVWSWVLVVSAFSRAASYALRPPEGSALTPTTQRIEGALTYGQWATVLVVYGVVITIGTLLQRNALSWSGHLVGIGLNGALASAILLSAVFDEAGWSALFPLVVVILVHLGRMNALGPRLLEDVEHRRQVRDRPRTFRWGGRRRG